MTEETVRIWVPHQRWHEKHHSHTGSPERQAEKYEDCWWCQRAQSVCKSKIRFATREDVDASVVQLNESRAYDKPVVRYRCRWCDGWHMTTATHKQQVKRAERQRRKWLVRSAQ